MDKNTFEIIMKEAKGNLITALENELIRDTGISRPHANLLANRLLDIIDMSNEQNK